MTNDEMEKRWPELPPFKADYVTFSWIDWRSMERKTKEYFLTQDNLKEVKEYIAAIEESMNS